jgi:hypothetical protein
MTRSHRLVAFWERAPGRDQPEHSKERAGAVDFMGGQVCWVAA